MPTARVRNRLHGPAPRLPDHHTLELLRVNKIALPAVGRQESAAAPCAMGFKQPILAFYISHHQINVAKRARITTNQSFVHPTEKLIELQGPIRPHAQRGAEKLREQNGLARAVLVFLKTNRFRPDLPQYSPSIVVEMECPQDTRYILHAAQEALSKIYRPKYAYKKAGVMMLDLTDADRQQLSLMDTPQT